jgi:hypothetical protein
MHGIRGIPKILKNSKLMPFNMKPITEQSFSGSGSSQESSWESISSDESSKISIRDIDKSVNTSTSAHKPSLSYVNLDSVLKIQDK